MNSIAGRMIATLLVAGWCTSTHAGSDPIDWRDQVIYFLMIDRFDDGNPANNDQGAGEFDPTDRRKFSGGDLAGVGRRLDYILGLGATALWITPPVANQWWDPRVGYGGYHGYWARDFKSIDAHFGTLDDYVALGHATDAAGLALVQDIVVNHVGNYFGYPETFEAARPERGFLRWADSSGQMAPSQSPFDLNDVRNAAHRKAGIYHWTPRIKAHDDLHQEHHWQLADLDDLNTENKVVRRALRDSYGYWMRTVGVDAFRVDTAYYVPPDYFRDFLFARDSKAPGITRLARKLGKPEFHVFGEGFGIDRPFDDAAARRIDGYMRDTRGRDLLPGMLNFPLYGSLKDVFAGGQGTDVLAHRITSMMAVHKDPWRMPTFVDNHDVDRFLAGGSEAGLRQALLALFTLPGIPTIYYGTEQGFDEPRESMFAGGYGAKGGSRFDVDAPLYRFIAVLSAMRRELASLRRGTPKVLASSASAGALAYVMGEGKNQVLVLMNSADTERLLVIESGLPEGSSWTSRFTIDGLSQSTVVDAAGRMTVVLPPRGGWVLLKDAAESKSPTDGTCADLRIEEIARTRAGDLVVKGRAPPQQDSFLVLNGDLDRAKKVVVDAHGTFRAHLRTDSLIDAGRAHDLRLFRPHERCAGDAQSVIVERQWTEVAKVDDPAGDDRGRSGQLRYPDAVGETNRPGDLRALTVHRTGNSLRLTITLANIVQTWNPANGFDHVALTLFIESPDERANTSAIMPMQRASLPDGMRWSRRWRAHGWSNALFASDGAETNHEGRTLDGGARIVVDRAAGVIRVDLPADTLDLPESLTGTRVYLNTWDYDAGYRGLTTDGHGFTFAGGIGSVDEPLLLDELGPIRLP